MIDATATTKKLEHLPVIAAALKRLDVAKAIDELSPPDPRNRVTTGQCVEALVVSILSGTHTLYRVDQLLAGYDLELGLGWEADAGCFHDERLARGLDALVRMGLNKAVSVVFVRALREYELDLEILRLDTTSASVHGAYAASKPPEQPDDPLAIPHLTKGRSKDRRGLKQIVFGTAVTDDGFPVHGRAASGNRADPLELRHLMRRVAERVPDPRGTTIVGDSKLCAGETLLLSRRLGFHFVTLVPKSMNAREEALVGFRAARRRGELETFLEKKGRGGEVETWRGCSVAVVFEYEDKAAGVVTRSLYRSVVVESSGLKRQKQGSLVKAREREKKALEKEARAQRLKVYRCQADADEACARLRAKAPRFHRLDVKTGTEDVTLKRPRAGRPKKTERRTTERVFRAWFEIQEDQERFDEILSEESSYVLVTSHLAHGDSSRTNRQIFETYHDQWTVERTMHWLKGALDFAPVFLKTPARIAALTQVYVIALMVYALIQRDARLRLAAAKTTIPGDLKSTSKPTTQVVFRLFEKVTVSRRGRGRSAVVENLTTVQVAGYKALGIDVLSRGGVRARRPRTPRPGDRGCYPLLSPGRRRPSRRPMRPA